MSASTCVCIVGAGRMGRALAGRIGPGHQVVLVSRHPTRFTTPDGRVLAAGRDPAAARACAVVLLAVPAPEVERALGWIAPVLPDGVLIANLATELLTRDLAWPGLRLVGCKIVGQSGEIARGVPAALIVTGAREAERALLTEVLRRVGVVIDAPEELVAGVNELVARHMVAAYLTLVQALDQLELPESASHAAVNNLAPGTWRAVVSGNTGPFLRKIMQEAAVG